MYSISRDSTVPPYIHLLLKVHSLHPKMQGTTRKFRKSEKRTLPVPPTEAQSHRSTSNIQETMKEATHYSYQIYQTKQNIDVHE